MRSLRERISVGIATLALLAGLMTAGASVLAASESACGKRCDYFGSGSECMGYLNDWCQACAWNCWYCYSTCTLG